VAITAMTRSREPTLILRALAGRVGDPGVRSTTLLRPSGAPVRPTWRVSVDRFGGSLATQVKPVGAVGYSPLAQ